MGGQSGAGKTHLCTAVTVHYIRKGKEARYMLWRDEIAQIKAIVTDSAAYAARMDALKKTPVLYIDDLFKGSLKDGIHDDNFDVDEELKKPTFTKAGDIWTLGRHRLICGDSTKPESYELCKVSKGVILWA